MTLRTTIAKSAGLMHANQVDAVEWALAHNAAHLHNVDKERAALYEQGKSLQVCK